MVVAGNGQVPVCRGQVRLLADGRLPVLNGLLILASVIQKFTQVIVGSGCSGEQCHGCIQNLFLQEPVGKAQIRGKCFGTHRISPGLIRMPELFGQVCQSIVFHRTFLRTSGEYIHGILQETGFQEFIGGVQVRFQMTAADSVQSLRAAGTIDQGQIQRIHSQAFIQKTCKGFVGCAQVCQNGGFQGPGFHVMPAAQQAFVCKVQCARQVLVPDCDAGQMIVCSACSFAAPGCLVKGVQCLRQAVQGFQGEPQIQVSFSGIWVRIPPGLFPDGRLEKGQALFCLCMPQKVQSVGIVQPDVGGIPKQTFQVIVRGKEGCVTVLLQVLSGQVQFFQ